MVWYAVLLYGDTWEIERPLKNLELVMVIALLFQQSKVKYV